jgi:hypothetical protein
MIATSSLRTIAVKTWDVNVVAPSSAVASTPSDALYYTYAPVEECLFLVRAAGGLASESFDGASWLDENLPGSPAKGSEVAALDFKDPNGTLEPQVFGRTAAGHLFETYPAGSTWSTTTIPGAPASNTPVVAIEMEPSDTAGNVSTYPAVFYLDSAGAVEETYFSGSAWKNALLPTRQTSQPSLAVGTTTENGRAETTLYTIGVDGSLVVTTQDQTGWSATAVPSPVGVASDSPLVAVTSGAVATPGVFFLDESGYLAEASPPGSGSGWTVTELTEKLVDPNTPLVATNYAPSSGPTLPEVFSESTEGELSMTYEEASTWSTETLPGTAARLLGLAYYPVPGGPQALVFTGPDGRLADSRSSPSRKWLWTLLPGHAVTFAGRVKLYAAAGANYESAVHAAKRAGLPASQVTGSFAIAWADALSGDYLVITVGLPATDALDFNACGWPNPSHAIARSTPFGLAGLPLKTLPGADLFEEAAGGSLSTTARLADDLTYYAAQGKFPAGQAKLPSEAGPRDACPGEPAA